MKLLRTVGGWFSRSEWMIRLLNLSRAEEPRTEPGLLLIQIDGLGFTEFRRGLRENHLPFLKRLGRKRFSYVSHPHYTGMPSNTPGVQGALFYGINTCVPAFSFMDHTDGRVCHMFDQASAASVEARLQQAGEPLLKGGSSYGNIFSGGAKDAHFCATSMGWGGVLKALNPPALALLILLNAHIVLRAAALAVLETLLAVLGSLRGIITGRGLLKELGFIPLRVAVCIVLREVITASACMDLARGVRVIHVNLAGYDEQAHQRGPSSSFARWSLRGIDSAIGRMWRAASRATRRGYAVWIYSDHGQEDTVPYAREHGRSIQTAVAEVLEPYAKAHDWQIEHATGIAHWRAKLLNTHALVDTTQAAKPSEAAKQLPRVLVAAMGPVGHIYVPEALPDEIQARMAETLVSAAKIPLVLATVGKQNEVRAWTAEGVFDLPKDAEKILGADHPYVREIAEDLVRLCQHPDAGQFVISGWRSGGKPGTFPMEFGAHAGPGPEETNGFVYLPAGVLTPPKDRPYVRNEDLRNAARKLLILTAPER